MHPTFLVLGGYGEMGRVTVHDLFETSKGNIIVVGRNVQAAEKFAHQFKSKRIQSAGIDVRNTKELAKLARGSDVVINCTDYKWNLHVMRACEIARKPYLDLGGLFHMTKKQLKLHRRWKAKNLLAVVGCGSTPGITNLLAAYGATLLDRVEEIHIRFADYDYAAAQNKTNKNVVLPYSFDTLADEFTKKAAVLHNGKLRFVAPLTGKEIEKFPKPIGAVTEYYTLHSELATFPSSFKEKGLRECSFKVSFPDEFIKKVKAIIKKRISPPYAGRTARAANIGTVTIHHDIEYLRVRLKGQKKGKKMQIILDCITKSKSSWHAPAGSVNTGIPPSIIAQQIVDRKIRQHGILSPEKCIKFEIFLKELKKRELTIKTDKTF